MLNNKFLIICLAIVVDPLIVESYNPLVSVFKTAFNVNVELVALSLTFHMLPLAILSLFSGTLSDLYYRPKILMYGLFISSIGSLLGALSPNIIFFLLSRSIQGIGSALIMPIALALIGDITPREDIGKAMGFSGVISGLFGVTLGPLLSGLLAGLEWRLLPLLFSTYSLVLGILSRMILSGLTISQKKGSFNLVFQQLKQTAGNRNIILLSAAGFISFFTFQGIMPLISNVFSLPPLLLEKSTIGVIFSIVGFVGILSSFFGGIIADKIGGRKNMMLGFLMMLPFMFLLTYANSYWVYLILLAALGSFNRLTYVSRSALAVELTPETRGTASSIFNFAGFLGFASAPIALTQIYTVFGMNSIYLLNVFLLMLCVIFAFLIRLDQRKK
ncbi:MAG: MFS transporter [Candidatus Bathyarchaeota archaeon]